MFIDGQWCEAASGRRFDVTDPATGEVIGDVPDGDAGDAARAIGAADSAFAAWRLMGERADDIARLMTREQGKPLKAARNEVTYAADFLRYYSEEATRVVGEWLPSQRPDQRVLVMRQPVGVVAMVTPWNYPVSMLTRKMGPALAAGCTLLVMLRRRIARRRVAGDAAGDAARLAVRRRRRARSAATRCR